MCSRATRCRRANCCWLLDDMQARATTGHGGERVKAAEAMLEAVTQNGTREQRQVSALEIEKNRLDRDQAQHNLEALMKLQSTGAASASEVQAAEQQLAAIEANLNATEQSARNRYSPLEVARARAALADAEASAAAARDVVNKMAFRAPIAGTVYSLDARPTEFAEGGKVLLQMADLNHDAGTRLL